jgi:hypothetical protein
VFEDLGGRRVSKMGEVVGVIALLGRGEGAHSIVLLHLVEGLDLFHAFEGAWGSQ